MCFENLSFYDASLKFPKHKRQRGYFPNNDYFPSLKPTQNNNYAAEQTTIAVEQRKSATPGKRTYVDATKTPVRTVKKSRIAGYDKAAHDACIIRAEKSPKKSRGHGNDAVVEVAATNSRSLLEDPNRRGDSGMEVDRNPIQEFRDILRYINSNNMSQRRQYVAMLDKIIKSNKSSLSMDVSEESEQSDGTFF